jgi:hypothetical protein
MLNLSASGEFALTNINNSKLDSYLWILHVEKKLDTGKYHAHAEAFFSMWLTETSLHGFMDLIIFVSGYRG